MSVLFDDARLNPPGRSTTGLWLSVVVHAVGALALIVVPIRASEKTPSAITRSKIVFIMPATAKLSPARVVAPRLPAPPRPMREPVRAEVAAPLSMTPAPVAAIVAKAIEPPVAPLVPAAAPAFERKIEKPVLPRPPETGLFERTNGARPIRTAAAVTTGGFDIATASPQGAADRGAVTTGGFGGAPAPRAAANGSGEVQKAGFDLRNAPTQPSVPALTKPIDRPVEIVFKPTPEYTDEARRARIEGTVSLELEFTAAGDVRVLRIVRGLGHGLDEAAQRAALRIRFKPAQSDGRPVDSRATVHITFRLS
jgi:TonB family protein